MEKKWKSRIYDDAETCNDAYLSLAEDDDYTDLKQYKLYIYYEEIK